MKDFILIALLPLATGGLSVASACGAILAGDGHEQPFIARSGGKMLPGERKADPLKGIPILRERESTTAKFYCGDRIVASGDTQAEVIAKCGEPAWRERRREERIEGVTSDRQFLTNVTTEEWVYNFGAQRFIRFLKFNGDRLVSIGTGGYGYDGRGSAQNCGNGAGLSRGDSKLEVIFKCGEPVVPEEPGDPALRRRASIERDEWTYNFGPDSFLYHLRFENGRLVDVTTGEYGH